MSKELEALRKVRNQLLADSDWTQCRDVTLSNDADWKTYRQALRDLTKTATPKVNADLTDHKSSNAVASLDMSSVTWPTKPS